ncbi:MAG: acyltransferase [Alphaproteobacteria bacterium]
MISPKASIGASCTIAASAIIHDNVTLGAGSTVGEFCILGHPALGDAAGQMLTIGEGALIRSHTVIYEGSNFGPQLRVGHSSMLREGIVAGINFQVGSFNDLEGDTTVGDWTRFHSNVHIGRGAVIGSFVWIFPYVVLTNDPLPPSWMKEGVTVGDGAAICTSAVVLPGATIGRGAFVAAMTRAKGDVPPAALVIGGEGKIIGTIDKLKHKASGKQHPWMSHAAGNYPPEAQERIRALHAQVLADIEATKAALAKAA